MLRRLLASLLLSFCLLIVGNSAPIEAANNFPADSTLLGTAALLPEPNAYMQIQAASFEGVTWDGKTVFFQSSMSGAPQVFRLTEEGWPYQLTTFADGIDFFSLSYGGNLSVIGASVGGSEYSQLFLMNAQTGQITQLTNNPGARYSAPTWAKDDRSIYYTSSEENKKDFFVYHMDLKSGSATKVFGDTNGVRGNLSIMQLTADGRQMIVTRYPTNVSNELYLVNVADGKGKKLTDERTDVHYRSAFLLPDNKTIWVTCNGNDEGISRLATMTVGVPTVKYTTDNWVDPKWEIEGVSASRDFKYQVVAFNENGYIRMKIREMESKQELKSPPIDGMIGGFEMDQNGRVFFSYQDPVQTSDVWSWDAKKGELKQLTYSSYSGVDKSKFRQPTLVTFKSFDELEIPSFLYLPASYTKGTPIPFIVYAHGGPESQYQPTFSRTMQYYMQNGFGIMAVNPRGSDGYGRKFLALDNYKLRKNSLKDYKAATDWLIANGYTAPGQIAITGGSYGGYVALGMITEYPDLYAAASAEVAIANFETFLENTASYRRALRESEYGPLTDREFLKEISPVHKVDKIKTPLLLIHGANDPRVPVGEARQMEAAIKERGGVVETLIFEDEGHGAAKTSNTIKTLETRAGFFKKYVKSGTQPN